MAKDSSSSEQSRPLAALVLAVSFILFAYTSQSEFSSPSLAENDLTLPSFNLYDYRPDLIESTDTSMCLPFHKKKSVNFYLNSAREPIKPLKPIHTISLEFQEQLRSLPKPEGADTNKYNFLAKNFDFELKDFSHDPSSPFSFNEIDNRTSLVNESFLLEKATLVSPSPLADLSFQTLIPSSFNSPSASPLLLIPSPESTAKLYFDSHSYAFVLSDTVKDYSPYSFSISSCFEEKLTQSTLSREKASFKPHPCEDFVCLPHLYLRNADEKKIVQTYLPDTEPTFSLLVHDSLAYCPDKALEHEAQELTYTLSSNINFPIPECSLVSPEKKQWAHSGSRIKIASPYFETENIQELAQINFMPQLEASSTLLINENDLILASALVSLDNIIIPDSLNSALTAMDLALEEKPSALLNLSHFIPLSLPREVASSIHIERYIELPNENVKGPFLSSLINTETRKENSLPLFEKTEVALQRENLVLNVSTAVDVSEIPIFSEPNFYYNFTVTPINHAKKNLSRSFFYNLASTLPRKELSQLVMQTPLLEVSPYHPTFERHSAMLEQNLPQFSTPSPSPEFPTFAMNDGISMTPSADDPFEINAHDSIRFANSNLTFSLPKLQKRAEVFESSKNIASLEKLQPLPQYNKDSDLPSLYTPPQITLPTLPVDRTLLGFTLASVPPSLKETHLDYLKEKTVPQQMDFIAPPIRGKKPLASKHPILPRKALEEIPRPAVITKLMIRQPQFPNTKMLTTKNPVPTAVPSSDLSLAPTKLQPGPATDMISALAEKSLEFTLASAPLSLKENRLDYQKDKTIPQQMEFIAPPVKGKKPLANKPHMLPKKALEEIPRLAIITELMTRQPQFPNTKGLMTASPVPTAVPLPGLSLATIELPTEPATDMISSQAQEMIEDYEQENRISSSTVALASPTLEVAPSEEETHTINQSNRFTQAFLTEIPPPSYLETVTYHNEFEPEVYYSPKEDGKGYSFAIKLKPNPKLNFGSPHQNYLFIIDGSSSIKKHRFGVFKEGVNNALSYLKEGDSFNILVADAELIPYNKTSTSWNKGSIAKAKNFLNSREYRGFFIDYNAFDLLADATKFLDPEKENVIILITDGHSFETLKHHKDDFVALAAASKGRFSLFTATASNNNNLAMLDILSAFNHGELLYSKTNAAFPRQLAKLVKHLEQFVAKDIHIHVTSHSQETGIEFYPNQEALPALYADHPYIIYGSIDKLKDFDIILQGRSGDQWINIKQRISFKNAEPAPYAIKRGFALQQAYVCYDYYLKKNDSYFLNEAERILSPLIIPAVTQ